MAHDARQHHGEQLDQLSIHGKSQLEPLHSSHAGAARGLMMTPAELGLNAGNALASSPAQRSGAGRIEACLEDAPVDTPHSSFEAFDIRLTRWSARHAITMLRVSVAVIFLWFGVLKFFPGLSPAQDLAGRTIGALSFGLIPPGVSVPLLATLETVIGLGLLSGQFLRATLLLLLLQMMGTVTPLLLFPRETFTVFPIVPTLEGQYIIKNLVLMSAAILMGATVRGGKLIADPDAARAALARERS